MGIIDCSFSILIFEWVGINKNDSLILIYDFIVLFLNCPLPTLLWNNINKLFSLQYLFYVIGLTD